MDDADRSIMKAEMKRVADLTKEYGTDRAWYDCKECPLFQRALAKDS